MKKRNHDGFPFDDLAESHRQMQEEAMAASSSMPNEASSWQPKFDIDLSLDSPATSSQNRDYDFSGAHFSEVAPTSVPEPAPRPQGYYQHPAEQTGYFAPKSSPSGGGHPSRERMASGNQDTRTANYAQKLNHQIRFMTALVTVLALVVVVLGLVLIFGGRSPAVTATVAAATTNTTLQTSSSSVVEATTAATTPPPAATTTLAPNSLAALQPSEENPVVALTFDDGPSAVLTPQLLDVLKEKGVKVTFFLLGQNVENVDSAILKRMVDEGHEIGNHSYDHSIYTNLSAEQIRSQLTKTNDAIFKAAGVTPTVMRPPTGASNDTVLSLAKEMGMAVTNWSWESCPEDWVADHQTADFISKYVIDKSANGHLVLLHDIHKATVESVGPMIDGLKAKGYRFATVSEALQASKDGFQPGKMYYYF